MKRIIPSIAVLGLTAAVLAATCGQAISQEAKKEQSQPKAAAAKAEAGAKKQGLVPFRGKITQVDSVAKTIKVGERTFYVTSETRLTKAGKPATFDDAKVGEEIAGSYRKAEDGKLMARTIRIGPRPEPAGGEKKDKKSQTQ